MLNKGSMLKTYYVVIPESMLETLKSSFSWCVITCYVVNLLCRKL